MPRAKAKSVTDVRSLARQHSERAIRVLAGIMDQPDCPPASRIAAAQVLLDRGFGKPVTTLAGDADAPLVMQRVERVIVDKPAKDKSPKIAPVTTATVEQSLNSNVTH